MSVYFVDTSALAKRYVPEVGSQWVLSWILPSRNNVVVIAEPACALHAASILGVSMTFISADDDLLEAAHAEGFVTDNPNHHP